MPASCVAANCNNSQTTPGITMHELPRNRPAVRRKWNKFIQFKRADFLAAPHHAHLCSEHFSECDFANPMEYTAWGFASKLTRCSGTLSASVRSCAETECPFSDVTKSGRVWRKVPENSALSVGLTYIVPLNKLKWL